MIDDVITLTEQPMRICGGSGQDIITVGEIIHACETVQANPVNLVITFDE
jgi:hypothetical protein